MTIISGTVVGQSSEKVFFRQFFTYTSKTIKKFEILTVIILLQILRSTTFISIIFLEISTEIGKKSILVIFYPKKKGFLHYSDRIFKFFRNMMYAY